MKHFLFSRPAIGAIIVALVAAAIAGAACGSGSSNKADATTTSTTTSAAAATIAGGSSPLTGRERDVLAAARGGATVTDIASTLFLSEGTVRNYLSAAIAKTGTRNRIEAVRVADERGWL